jgi:DNA-binding NarL/FixJ family response regulator
MPGGASSKSDPDSQMQAESLAAPKSHLLYVDARRLSRDYVSRQLALHLPEFAIDPAASAGELSGTRPYIATIAHTHTARVDEPATSMLVSRLARSLPGVPLLLLSDAETARDVVAAFHLGVRGYIPTSLSMRDAAEAIRFVCEGGTFIPASALATLAALSEPTEVPCPAAAAPAAFTTRQWEVLRRLWQGKPNKVIARELEVSEGTVKVHIRQMMMKLHARNRTEIVMLTHPGSQQGSHRAT